MLSTIPRPSLSWLSSRGMRQKLWGARIQHGLYRQCRRWMGRTVPKNRCAGFLGLAAILIFKSKEDTKKKGGGREPQIIISSNLLSIDFQPPPPGGPLLEPSHNLQKRYGRKPKTQEISHWLAKTDERKGPRGLSAEAETVFFLLVWQ